MSDLIVGEIIAKIINYSFREGTAHPVTTDFNLWEGKCAFELTFKRIKKGCFFYKSSLSKKVIN